jgi:hypothetical protein
MTFAPDAIWNDKAPPQKLALIKQRFNVNPDLEWLGITKHRSIYRVHNKKEQSRFITTRNEATEIILETHDTFWAFRWTEFVLHWSQQRPYGFVTPFPTVYSMVEDFDKHVRTLIKTGTVDNFNHLLRSGTIHHFA